ncbi:MAG: vanadium-dependent haloperoxidase, partial [Actinomycetota bacterium]|nr:vanadium-dependent haloperoxidase [Actinomycetota bacterium]
MKMRRRLVSAAALALVVVLGALAPIATVGVHAASAAAQPNEVTNWNRIAADTLVAFPPPAGGAAPALQVNMGMTQGAVYDAVNAIEPRHQPYLLATRFDPSASKEAAVATAAYAVLSSIVSTVPATIPFPNQASLLQSLADAYAASLAAIPDSPNKTAGIAAGNAAAAAMIAARQGDGRFGPSPWVPNDDAGHWQPQLNPDGTPILDPTPWVANVKPFLIQSSSQFRTEGPQALRSDAWAKDFNQVKRLGSVDSARRTPEQTHIAIFWQSAGGPALTWSAVARNLIEDPARAVDLGNSALLLAKMNLAGADAAINCWNDKYYWDFWRPWQAIHEAGLDGNPATDPDPSWTALLTAPYPEHPSGHLCLDGAHLEVLRMFFGTDEIGFDVTSSRFGGETRHFDRFSEPLEEIIDARIWA